jgi:hypothetical protein
MNEKPPIGTVIVRRYRMNHDCFAVYTYLGQSTNPPGDVFSLYYEGHLNPRYLSTYENLVSDGEIEVIVLEGIAQ